MASIYVVVLLSVKAFLVLDIPPAIRSAGKSVPLTNTSDIVETECLGMSLSYFQLNIHSSLSLDCGAGPAWMSLFIKHDLLTPHLLYCRAPQP